MNKQLTDAAITRALLGSAKVAKNGTPEQRAGMFKPNRPKAVSMPQRRASQPRAY